MDNIKNGWRGLTIQEIIQKVDLANVNIKDTFVKDDKKEEVTSLNSSEECEHSNTVIKTTYLGPKLWDQSFSITNEDHDNEEEDTYNDVMDMNEFLAENNIKYDNIEITSEPREEPRYSPHLSPPPSQSKHQQRPSIIIAPKRTLKVDTKKEILPKGENTFLYMESKRARLEREKEELRKKMELEVDFAPEDLALATIPGVDFDPKERAFDLEELRPQPIIKKRKKLFVPDDSKDGKYWDKRQKNNVAARRSREARRLKENQIALRAAFLEKENRLLKTEFDDTLFETTKLETERDILKKKLAQYECFAHN